MHQRAEVQRVFAAERGRPVLRSTARRLHGATPGCKRKICHTNIRPSELGQHQNEVVVRAPGVVHNMHLQVACYCLQGGKHALAGLPRRLPIGLRLGRPSAAQCLPLGQLGRWRCICGGVSPGGAERCCRHLRVGCSCSALTCRRIMSETRHLVGRRLGVSASYTNTETDYNSKQ